MERHPTAMFDRPLTPPADSPFSSFSNSSNSRTSEDTSQSCLSRLVNPAPENKKLHRSLEYKIAHRRRPDAVQELISQLRRYDGGSAIHPEYPLGVQDYRKLVACIDQLPETDSLKGFWYDKLHYDYDSKTQIFHIQVHTEIHERMLLMISEQIQDWLEKLKRNENAAIREFALAIRQELATSIKYSDRSPERMSIEEAAGGDSTPSSSSSDPPSPPDYSLRTAASNRASPIRTRSSAPGNNDQQTSIPADETQQASRSSDTVRSNAKEYMYDPDNSWRFASTQVEDEQAAFVLEVANTQSEELLYSKVEGLLGPCEATAVLVCRTDIPQSGRATLELWRRNKSQDTQQTLADRDLIWRTDILKAGGEVSDDQSSARISLNSFITRSSCDRFFNQYTNDELELFVDLAPLVIDTSKLGNELKEMKTREGRGDRNLDSTHEEDEINADRKRKFCEIREAMWQRMKTGQ